MKKYAIILMGMILLSLSTVGAASPFKILASVPPFVRPGDENVTIQLTVKLETGEYEDVEVELILSRYFSPSQEGSETFTLGDMSTKDITKPALGIAVFQLDVSSSATYGDYTVQVYITTKTGAFMDDFTIHVVGETLVEIREVTTSIDPIVPGSDFELTVSVKNIGSNALKWMKIILNPNPSAQISVSEQPTSQMTQIPTQTQTQTQIPSTSPPTSVIIPISSDLERVFKNISPGQTVHATYLLSVEPSVESENIAMGVTLVYQDETDMLLTENRTIGIKVQGTPQIELQGIEADPGVPYNGEEVIISITLENNGTAEARSVKVSISSSIGSYTSFIGSMNRDENNAAIFKILIPDMESQFPQKLLDDLLGKSRTTTYPLTIQVFYEDLHGELQGFMESWELTAKTQPDKTVYYIIGAIILISVVVIWRVRSKRQLKALEE
ncbi:MAG: hypothetical protein HXS47_02595 [Theionarchaea archaeon]|nr:hypothetical protein [Theionarchaea archaeon]